MSIRRLKDNPDAEKPHLLPILNILITLIDIIYINSINILRILISIILIKIININISCKPVGFSRRTLHHGVNNININNRIVGAAGLPTPAKHYNLLSVGTLPPYQLRITIILYEALTKISINQNTTIYSTMSSCYMFRLGLTT